MVYTPFVAWPEIGWEAPELNSDGELIDPDGVYSAWFSKMSQHLAESFKGKVMGVEPVRAAPFAVGALLCSGVLWFVHDRWDARRDRVIERDRCVNVEGVNGDDLTVDEVMDFVRSQDARIVVDVRSSADASMFTVEELVNALDGEGVKYVEVPVLRVPKDVMLDVDSDPSVWKMVADGYREYVGSSIMAREAVAQMRGMAQSVYPQKLVVLMSGEVSYSYQFMVLRDRLCAEARVFRLKTNSLLY